MIRRPEWTDVQLDDNHWTTVEVIGGCILRSTPVGYATAAGVAKLLLLHREVIAAAIKPGAMHVHIADYTGFIGATFDSRRAFAEDLKTREGLAALVVHNAPPLFKLSIKLGKRILGLQLPIEITSDYASAIRVALDILHDAGIEADSHLVGHQFAHAMRPRSESGGLELDSLELQYETIDGHILHAHSRPDLSGCER